MLVGSELVRSWFEPNSVMKFGFEPVCDQLRTSFEPASVMEFGFKNIGNWRRTVGEQMQVRSFTDHDQCPVLVDHLTFGNRRAVDVDDPEQRGQRRSGGHLAPQRHVAVSLRSRRRRAPDQRPICNRHPARRRRYPSVTRGPTSARRIVPLINILPDRPPIRLRGTPQSVADQGEDELPEGRTPFHLEKRRHKMQ